MPLLAHLFDELTEYLPWDALLTRFQSIPGADAIVDQLITQDILLVKGSLADQRDRLVDETWKWSHDARIFHFSTRRLRFERDPEAQRKSLVQLAKRVAPPAPFKDYHRSDVVLGGSFEEASDDFWNVLRTRRTVRDFAREKLSFQDFSTLLLWTWGYTDFVDSSELGSYILRTSPSGGARHPVEVYPVVLRVEDVNPGIYHYSVQRHELESIRSGDFEGLLERICPGMRGIGNASVMFFMTAILGRSMWKYGQSHAYRVIHLDAGHLGQTFHLVCTRLGLAPFTAAAIHYPEVEDALGIDGVSEIAIYAAATGIPLGALS